jgi:hypothetical protein
MNSGWVLEDILETKPRGPSSSTETFDRFRDRELAAPCEEDHKDLLAVKQQDVGKGQWSNGSSAEILLPGAPESSSRFLTEPSPALPVNALTMIL